MEDWKYAQNTLLSVTATSYKLMNILLVDHVTRLSGDQGADSDFMAMLSCTTSVKTARASASGALIFGVL